MLEALHSINPYLIIIVVLALAFDFTNGFHDTANSIATVVSTRVMSPRSAILMSATLNFVGALYSTNVAKTIAKGLVDTHSASQEVILAAIIGAITWNLITWRYGIPSSSSHALIGGLVGAAIVHSGFKKIIWGGVLEKVVLPMVLSPLIGGLFGFILMAIIYRIFASSTRSTVSGIFHNLQRLSAAVMSYNHGQNDAQKTMGIITLALVAFEILPGGKKVHIPTWVIYSCATAMALGTAAGGWRIIHTMGQKIIRLEPVHGFAAESAGSLVIAFASHMGMAVSTTHVITGSIFGVGAAKNLPTVRWNTARIMVTAWGLTLPAAATVAALCFLLLHSGHGSIAFLK